MIGTEDLEYLVKLALYSAYVKDEKPLSLLITAKVESGKTTIASKFMHDKNKGIVYLTDVTAYGIIKAFLPQLELGKINHLIIGDLITPLSKQQSTVRSFIAFLNNLIEEGIVELQTYANSVKVKGIRCGIITTIPENELFDKRHKWATMGFMSRVLPVSYSYSQQTAIEILQSIARREYYEENKVKLDFPKKQKCIELPFEIAEKLIPHSRSFAIAEKIYGFRYQKQLQVLLEANALIRKDKKVTEEDFQKILSLLKLIGLRYNQI